MNTPFGLANLWLEGDAITRFLALALLFCSIVTWVILLSRFWDLRNLRKLKSELDQFWRATSFPGGYGSAWCAAFVCWCVQQTGVFSDSTRPKDAGVSNFESWARSSKPTVTVIANPRTINAGDIVTFKTSSHIGIASTSSDSNGFFLSIDGNTHAPSGVKKPAGVHEKKRNVNIIKNVISVNV
jgi:hypothetical protein